MSTYRSAPLLIRLCSMFFAFMAVIAVMMLAALWAYPAYAQNTTISFFTNRVSPASHPISALVISGLFIFAGIFGASVLFRARAAYDIGIIYCITAAATLITLTALGIGVNGSPATCYALITIIFGGFLVYLLQNTARWKEG